MLMVLLAALSASAASVSMEVTPRETYVGVPVQVQITIENAQSHQAPVLPEIPGTTVQSNGAPRQQTSTTIINGAMSQSSTLIYSWSVTPRQIGAFTIPSITVDVDGQSRKTDPVKVLVSRSDTGDLLFIELKGSRPSVYVGEQLDVRLQVYIKQFVTARGALSAIDLVNRIDFRNSRWGVFEEPLMNLVNRREAPTLSDTTRKDSSSQEHAFHLFELKRTLYPDRPGPLDVGEITVTMSYPTRLTRTDDFFGRINIEGRPIAASLARNAIVIKPIPIPGRPAIWNGAVGQYQISASAKPTDVAVGDPITLGLAISGTGRLDTLLPPPLAQIPELTHDFKVPSDPIGGVVDQRTKRFTQSIRAIHASIAQIPPIPFAYFDPRTEKFVTVHSNPIPIKVRAAQNLSMSQIVEAPGSTGKSGSPQLTEVQSGILANYSDMDEVLGQQGFRPGWGTATMLMAPPVVFVAAFVSRRRADRLRADRGLARRRTARRNAIARIRSAGADGGGATASVVADALTHYVADRLNLPPGGLTRAEIVQRLNRQQVNGAVLQQLDTLLQDCEGMRYAGQDGVTGQRLENAAIEAIEAMEHEKL